MGSVSAIPHLIEKLVVALDQGGNTWWIHPNTSRFSFGALQDGKSFIRVNTTTCLTTYLRPPTLPADTYVSAIQSISKRKPERVEKLLRSYLTNEKQIARAVAVSVLFEGTDRAREYVSKERVFVLVELQTRG